MFGMHVKARRFVQRFIDAIKSPMNLGWTVDFTSGIVRMSNVRVRQTESVIRRHPKLTNSMDMHSETGMINNDLKRRQDLNFCSVVNIHSLRYRTYGRVPLSIPKVIYQSPIQKRYYPGKKRLANKRCVEEVISDQVCKYELEAVEIEVVG